MVIGKRILVHDYSGHPFQVQLSRSLAGRGYEVLHVHSASFQTPKGELSRRADDPIGLEIVGIRLDEAFEKNGFLKRRSQEVEIGRRVAAMVAKFHPAIVLSANAPLDAQAEIVKAARACGSLFVFWLQDIYSEAISRILARKLPVVGAVIAARYQRLEFELLRSSDHVVAITEDFLPILRRNGVRRQRVSVVENWAPLGPSMPAIARKIDARPVRAVYAGTLGYKHDPGILLAAAASLPVEVDVLSEGRVAEELARRAAAEGLSNLHVKPWVPFSDLPRVLGGADIMVAMIEKDAGVYSVPSKVLTYLSHGKPVLGSIPAGNLARRILERERAGLVSEPGDGEQFLADLRQLVGDEALRNRLGANGRAYAERNFDIDRITDRFEGIFGNLRSLELQAI
ncbi:glycosyltransferase family 4 protein [Rhizobium sp. S152]|uniref:glycosyltransferase family 4 protein n=1 Tax=Rhizobium sp. S152 TaxID=3055038 RepID=UPI0025A9413B|nr:glycosyltransferase family 4 protein [Rhizobium sp. S152]MDM9626079.1 glycosyltransferase family 4 protein [Rhizobium sp. S152]